jgi:hypothetical protein
VEGIDQREDEVASTVQVFRVCTGGLNNSEDIIKV